MKTRFISIVTALLFLFNCDSNVKWNNLNTFIIYDKQNLTPNNTNNESYRNIDKDEIKLILSSSIEIDKAFLWKGYRLAKVNFKNGDSLFIKISNYDGVFYDIKNKSLYKIPIDKKDSWNRIIHSN